MATNTKASPRSSAPKASNKSTTLAAKRSTAPSGRGKRAA